jgi:ACT domain-containing protein
MALKINIKEAIEAIEQAEGVVTVACRSLGISRVTFYRYCKDFPELQKAYDETKAVTDTAIVNELLGIAFDSNHKDQLAAIKYYTSCKMGWRVSTGLDVTSKDEKIDGFKVIVINKEPDDS